MKYRGAIFDMDGTLIDSMPAWENLGRDYLIGLGANPPADLNALMKTMSLTQSAAYFRERFGLTLSSEEITRGVMALIEQQYRESIPLKPHVLPFLQKLTAAGVRCCVATATPRHLAEAALNRLGALPYFEFILTCTEEGLGKDDPAFFTLAREKLGLPRDSVIVFEDALFAARSAKAAGLSVAGVYDASAAEDTKAIRETADHYICSFDHWEV